MKKIYICIIFLLLTTVSINEPIMVKKAIPVKKENIKFKVNRFSESKNQWDATKYLQTIDNQWNIPRLRYDNKEYRITLDPYISIKNNDGKNTTVYYGFQIEILW